MKVIIAGYGVVGRVTADILKEAGHEVTIHDPPLGIEAEPADVCVVCTPCLSGYLDDPAFAVRSSEVVVRSSVVPQAFDALLPGHRHHWPEFLTERTAEEDALAPDKLIWGSDHPASGFVWELLGTHYLAQSDRVVMMSLRASAITKLAINAYYTTKVLLANAFFDAVNCSPTDYESVLEGMGLDHRITLSHTNIYQDGYRGVGGKCLPKDTRNLAEMLAKTDKPDAAALLRGLLDANDALRAKNHEPHGAWARGLARSG